LEKTKQRRHTSGGLRGENKALFHPRTRLDVFWERTENQWKASPVFVLQGKELREKVWRVEAGPVDASCDTAWSVSSPSQA